MRDCIALQQGLGAEIWGIAVVRVVGDWASNGKKKKAEDHAYLAVLVFCARGRGELLIVQHWRSSNKRGPHCCCH